MEAVWAYVMLSPGCAHVGPSRAHVVGLFWAKSIHVEPCWAHLRPMLAQVEPMLGYVGPILGPCPAYVGPMLAYVGPCWAFLGAMLGPCLGHLC